jgi:hypothetical protein
VLPRSKRSVTVAARSGDVFYPFRDCDHQSGDLLISHDRLDYGIDRRSRRAELRRRGQRAEHRSGRE